MQFILRYWGLVWFILLAKNSLKLWLPYWKKSNLYHQQIFKPHTLINTSPLYNPSENLSVLCCINMWCMLRNFHWSTGTKLVPIYKIYEPMPCHIMYALPKYNDMQHQFVHNYFFLSETENIAIRGNEANFIDLLLFRFCIFLEPLKNIECKIWFVLFIKKVRLYG